MEINPADIRKMTAEYERALASGASDDVTERLILLEEAQLDGFDALLRTGRNGKTLTYLKNLNFRALNILSRKIGQSSYIPSVRTPEGCSSPASRVRGTQLDIFILLDRLDEPFADKAELIALENRKSSLLASL